MLAINYSAAVFVITACTYIIMSLLGGKGIIDSLPFAFAIGLIMGAVTLISCIFLLKKKNIKVYEIKDDK